MRQTALLHILVRWITHLGALALILALLAPAIAAQAQQREKVARIGFLCSLYKPGPALLALRQGLRELGYVDGQNVVIETRFAEEKLERLPSLAAELARLKVDVLVPMGPAATRAAKQATTAIPIVLAGAADPVGTGLVASLSRPGGNITGISSLTAELASKRLQLLSPTASFNSLSGQSVFEIVVTDPFWLTSDAL